MTLLRYLFGAGRSKRRDKYRRSVIAHWLPPTPQRHRYFGSMVPSGISLSRAARAEASNTPSSP